MKISNFKQPNFFDDFGLLTITYLKVYNFKQSNIINDFNFSAIILRIASRLYKITGWSVLQLEIIFT